MQKSIYLLLLLFGLQSLINAQNIVLTDSTKFSLLTCSPGPAAYEKFGHSAIRVYDAAQSIDFIANWGLFDFDKPGFYYKFVKGETYYMLGLNDTFYFLESYRQRNSQVTEQFLNLNQEEKQRLLDVILTNYRPENREYLYNFVFDNCATRPRDRIIELFPGRKIEYNYVSEQRTYREWIVKYVGRQSWLMFGIDLVFGKDADNKASQWETMFLPEILSNEFQETTIAINDSVSVPLISGKHVLVDNEDVKVKANVLGTPLIVMLFILLIGVLISYVEIKKRKYFKLFDFILFLVTGLAGLIIFYLMFFSIHPLVKSNLNILWCFPFNIFVAFMLWFKGTRPVLFVYFLIYAILIFVALVLSATNIQIFNIAFLPLMGLLLLRSVHWLYRYYQKKNYKKKSRQKKYFR
ncbi:MAG: DUF4105 domain-containing protein [Porphyromonadaceae bacterium]|jgi:hypothetical protein|nr:DUF4105 domain-containing protein [Porphyromonadaceae bacterium]